MCTYKYRDRCVNSYFHVYFLCQISGTPVYLGRDKEYVQEMTGTANFQYIVIIKINTTMVILMIIMRNLYMDGPGTVTHQQGDWHRGPRCLVMSMCL